MTAVVDYVIVGAGSAGCVLARRLAEAGRSVLVLEAGGDDRGIDEVRIPAAFPNLFRTEHDWDYETVEQRQAGGRRMYWPRGRLLGGSSSITRRLVTPVRLNSATSRIIGVTSVRRAGRGPRNRPRWCLRAAVRPRSAGRGRAADG